MRTHLAAAIAAIALSGCASIIKGGGPQSFAIRSQPVGADVRVVDTSTGVVIAAGKTPYTAMLKKSRGFFQGAKYKVQVELPGYQPVESLLDTNVNGWYVAGNIVFGGLIGWLIVDPATGAMWSLERDAIDVPLAPLGAPPAAPPAELKQPAAQPSSSIDAPYVGVLALDDVPLSARANLVPLN